MKSVETYENEKDFIMLPRVDFCFKELMQDEKVRQGLISAILDVDPEEIRSTILLPTILRKEYKEDKYGILDVRVQLIDGTQIDLEMQVEPFEYWTNRVLFYWSKMYTSQIEAGQDYDEMQKCIHVSILAYDHFKEDSACYHKVGLSDLVTGKQYSDLLELYFLEITKVPPVTAAEKPIIQWMRFLGGSCKEELKAMSEQNEYIRIAYDDLEKMSLDKQKRLEYETRQKNIRDYNSQMKSAERRGEKRGEKRGEERGRQRGIAEGRKKAEEQFVALGQALCEAGRSNEAVRAMVDEEYLEKLLKEFHIG